MMYRFVQSDTLPDTIYQVLGTKVTEILILKREELQQAGLQE